MNYFAFIIERMKKTHILMDFQPKILNFQMALNSIDVYNIIDYKKFHSQP